MKVHFRMWFGDAYRVPKVWYYCRSYVLEHQNAAFLMLKQYLCTPWVVKRGVSFGNYRDSDVSSIILLLESFQRYADASRHFWNRFGASFCCAGRAAALPQQEAGPQGSTGTMRNSIVSRKEFYDADISFL